MLCSVVSEATHYIWITIIVSFIQFMGRRALEHAIQWIASPPMPPFPRNTAKTLSGPNPIPPPPPPRGRTLTVSSSGSWTPVLSQSVSSLDSSKGPDSLNSDVDSDSSPNTCVAAGSRSGESSPESRSTSNYVPGGWVY